MHPIRRTSSTIMQSFAMQSGMVVPIYNRERIFDWRFAYLRVAAHYSEQTRVHAAHARLQEEQGLRAAQGRSLWARALRGMGPRPNLWWFACLLGEGEGYKSKTEKYSSHNKMKRHKCGAPGNSRGIITGRSMFLSRAAAGLFDICLSTVLLLVLPCALLVLIFVAVIVFFLFFFFLSFFLSFFLFFFFKKKPCWLSFGAWLGSRRSSRRCRWWSAWSTCKPLCSRSPLSVPTPWRFVSFNTENHSSHGSST